MIILHFIETEDIKAERQNDKKELQRDRKTERQKDRKTERQKDRKAENRKTERNIFFMNQICLSVSLSPNLSVCLLVFLP